MMSKRKSGKHQALTMVLIPHGREVISLKIPYWLVRTAIVTAGLVIILVVYLAYSFSAVKAEIATMGQLRKVNAAQAKEIKELSKVSDSIQQKAQAVEDLDEQVRKLLGLEKASEKQPSRGTGSRNIGITEPARSSAAKTLSGANLAATANLRNDMVRLDSQLDDQMASLTYLKKAVQQRLNYLASIPNRWPVYGRITSTFGTRKSPFGRRREFHDGLDIAARKGTPVRAAGTGIISFAGWKSGYGRVAIIKHGNGYSTWYAHNSAILVKSGEKVQKGQVISRVGSTGRSTGPHLHFMVTVNGKLTDPRKVLIR